MQCPFCAYGIKKHLAKLPGVTRVDVELANNQAILTVAPDAKVTDAQIQQAIRKAGFTPGKIEWRSSATRVVLILLAIVAVAWLARGKRVAWE